MANIPQIDLEKGDVVLAYIPRLCIKFILTYINTKNRSKVSDKIFYFQHKLFAHWRAAVRGPQVQPETSVVGLPAEQKNKFRQTGFLSFPLWRPIFISLRIPFTFEFCFYGDEPN